MTELTFCCRRLEEVSSRLAFIELFEKRLQELRPLHYAEQIQLSELKNACQLELTCGSLHSNPTYAGPSSQRGKLGAQQGEYGAGICN